MAGLKSVMLVVPEQFHVGPSAGCSSSRGRSRSETSRRLYSEAAVDVLPVYIAQRADYGNFNSASEKGGVSSVKQAIVLAAFLLTASLAYPQSSTKSSTRPAGSVPERPPHSVTLTWTPTTSVAVTGYNIYRSSSKGGPYRKINSAEVAGTSYVDSDVLAGQTYYYVVTAVNQRKAESRYSAEAHAKVPTP